LPYSSILMMKATGSSEMLDDFQRPPRRNIPEDRTRVHSKINNGLLNAPEDCLSLLFSTITE
jgi:hypothetical protein